MAGACCDGRKVYLYKVRNPPESWIRCPAWLSLHTSQGMYIISSILAIIGFASRCYVRAAIESLREAGTQYLSETVKAKKKRKKKLGINSVTGPAVPVPRPAVLRSSVIFPPFPHVPPFRPSLKPLATYPTAPDKQGNHSEFR